MFLQWDSVFYMPEFNDIRLVFLIHPTTVSTLNY